ncbi:diaminopimelate decarboxylase [Sulfuriferula multivorans]|uniref:Diaminopimelate decarboxylase n=1 Tax=Sulfuriferula multivorans TaxID=1559896 RepID=A0A401JGG1_9PROT|nr:diaminopimelate decarboxylase [Sulfuriferula multivorans]GBL46731.1 diaminopimelate decarboxylase [Sulfuriferula multivorans]
MNPLSLQHNHLHIESADLVTIAETYATPCYVYSHAALTQAFQAFEHALQGRDHLICYAMKANPNLAILRLFANLGAGFDIVSGGELQRVMAAGGNPGKVVFSGVGKTADEMRLGLDCGILCFNVESEAELQRLNEVAGAMSKIAPVSLRVNPDVDANTHPYISTGLKGNKFGVAHEDALRLYRLAASLPNLKIKGIDCHIGSQLTETRPFADALDRVLTLVDALEAEGIELHHLDLGGGLGIRYQDETPPPVADYIAALLDKLKGRAHTILLEPGRALVGNAGLLLTRVEYIKHGMEKNFAIVDAAMNDLMRPALYDAHHNIVPVVPRDGNGEVYEVVGPVCESGDFLGHERRLNLRQGDLLAILSAGAYGMSMSSNYNSRARAAEVLVRGQESFLIRERERIEDLFSLEHPLP